MVSTLHVKTHMYIINEIILSSHVATKRNSSWPRKKLLIQEKNVGKKIRKIIYFSWIVFLSKNNKHMDICQFHEIHLKPKISIFSTKRILIDRLPDSQGDTRGQGLEEWLAMIWELSSKPCCYWPNFHKPTAPVTNSLELLASQTTTNNIKDT